MDTLLTVVGLVVLVAWAVLWVLTSTALMAHEPKPGRRSPQGLRKESDPSSFRPVARSQ